MNFFKRKKEEKSKTEQINEQRNNIKLDIAVKLYKKGYSDEDVENIIEIIEQAERDIQEIKSSLNGTNINPKGDPMQPLANGIDKIKKRQLEMEEELKSALVQLEEKYSK